MTAALAESRVLEMIGAFVDISGPSPIDLSFGREWLAQFFGVAGFNVGAEIGVERGAYSETLCRANSRLKLYAVDAWQAYPGYREHVTQSKQDDLYRIAQGRLEPWGAEIVRQFSIKAAEQFAPASLDFVYIDAAHDLYQVVQDMVSWAPKVKPGGVVAGHDYLTRRGANPCHVQPAVRAFVESYGIDRWFVLRGDSAPSWFWVQR